MYHSITIGNKNTWDDWHLIPASRPLFSPPPVKTSTVNIPGGDGILDLSESLSGRPVFENRTGKLSFIVANDYKDWSALYSEIMAYLHGKRLRAILEDDPAYYYEGRFSVNAWQSSAQFSTITINYSVAPFKKEVYSTDSDWLWDPFNFEDGVITDYKNKTVNGTLSLTVYGRGQRGTLRITSSVSGMVVRVNNADYTLASGINTLRRVELPQGENTLLFTGNGVVSVEYEGGWL